MELIFISVIILALLIVGFFALKFLVMQPDIWIRGKHDYIAIAEAPDDESYSQKLNDPVIREILALNVVPLSLGQTDDGQENRQLVIHKRGHKR